MGRIRGPVQRGRSAGLARAQAAAAPARLRGLDRQPVCGAPAGTGHSLRRFADRRDPVVGAPGTVDRGLSGRPPTPAGWAPALLSHPSALHCKDHVTSRDRLRVYDVCADRRWATRATIARARKKSGVDPLQTTGAYAGSAFNFSPSALTVGRSPCTLQLARNVVSQQETSSPGGSLVGIRASPFLLTVRRSV